MYRKLATAAAILVAGLTVGAPAFALLTGPGANDRPHVTAAPGDGGGGGATTTTVKPHTEHPGGYPTSTTAPPASGGPEPGATTSTTVKHTEPPTSPTSPSGEEHRDLEQLNLRCEAGRTGGMGVARCAWSVSHSPTFARYVLWRQDPGQTQRRVVFQTTDRNTLLFYDKPLDAGTYHYGLLALDGNDKGVGAGGPAEVTVPAAEATTTTTAAPVPPKPGTMSFGCTLNGHVVICQWGASTSEHFAGYRLYREVPGSPAQLRWTTSDRNTTTASDGDTQPGATYKYRIVTMGTDGNPIAYGGPVTITIPTGDAPIQ